MFMLIRSARNDLMPSLFNQRHAAISSSQNYISNSLYIYIVIIIRVLACGIAMYEIETNMLCYQSIIYYDLVTVQYRFGHQVLGLSLGFRSCRCQQNLQFTNGHTVRSHAVSNQSNVACSGYGSTSHCMSVYVYAYVSLTLYRGYTCPRIIQQNRALCHYRKIAAV